MSFSKWLILIILVETYNYKNLTYGGGGEIGRHARLWPLCPLGHVSSTLILRPIIY